MPYLRCTTYSPGASLNGSIELFTPSELSEYPSLMRLFCSATSAELSNKLSTASDAPNVDKDDDWSKSGAASLNLSRTMPKPLCRRSANNRRKRSPAASPECFIIVCSFN